ncbi:hypothetical protein AMK59_7348 [Oryctes borbonicus]|uniref:ABC transporter ATP-binding protein n=1 Tax=Oryctes borbonicus TaxID=1629725 RepID=A0A0T6AVX0_9SCAR|nr:hypothetical protein AMK59_7348 [Oryctes borbonicus]
MTINETFKYYGRMLQLKSKYINERISYLHDLLALPVGKSLISQCNDSEKRQISFAIAILHEPELLLLDEPCQGVDPVARTNIWEHLTSLVKKGVTVFLTTQNLSEANKADRLGVLRSGYLLMEGSPFELIADYRETSLESLYTSIYSFRIRKNMITEKKSIHEHPRVKIERLPATGSDGFLYIEEPDDIELKKNKRGKWKSFSTKFSYLKRFLKILPNCKRLGTLLYRDCLLTFRSYLSLLAIFLVPLALVVLFSLTVGGHPANLKVGVVNYEATDEMCRLAAEVYVSCQVLGQIDKDVVKTVTYEKYDVALRDALNMKISAILLIGEKLTQQLLRTMADIVTNRIFRENPSTAQLILQIDMTNRVVASAIEHTIKRAVEKYLEKATNDSRVHNATIGYPLRVRQRPAAS